MSKAAYAFFEDIVSLGQAIERSLKLLAKDGSIYAIVEKVDEIRFRKLDELECPEEWNRGRIFGSEGELRWLRCDSLIHALLLIDAAEELPAGFRESIDLSNYQYDPSKGFRYHLLWGEKGEREKVWREGRIPEDLEYPVPAGEGKHAWLGVRRYVNPQGVVEFARYGAVVLSGEKPEKGE